MIARIWHGRTSRAKADEYLKFLNRRAIPDYESVSGNRGVYILHHLEDEEAHFLTLTFLDSKDAIERFAGPNIETVKYYPEDEDFLLEFEPTVEHYEVFSTGEEDVMLLKWGLVRQFLSSRSYAWPAREATEAITIAVFGFGLVLVLRRECVERPIVDCVFDGGHMFAVGGGRDAGRYRTVVCRLHN